MKFKLLKTLTISGSLLCVPLIAASCNAKLKNNVFAIYTNSINHVAKNSMSIFYTSDKKILTFGNDSFSTLNVKSTTIPGNNDSFTNIALNKVEDFAGGFTPTKDTVDNFNILNDYSVNGQSVSLFNSTSGKQDAVMVNTKLVNADNTKESTITLIKNVTSKTTSSTGYASIYGQEPKNALFNFVQGIDGTNDSAIAVGTDNNIYAIDNVGVSTSVPKKNTNGPIEGKLKGKINAMYTKKNGNSIKVYVATTDQGQNKIFALNLTDNSGVLSWTNTQTIKPLQASVGEVKNIQASETANAPYLLTSKGLYSWNSTSGPSGQLTNLPIKEKGATKAFDVQSMYMYAQNKYYITTNQNGLLEATKANNQFEISKMYSSKVKNSGINVVSLHNIIQGDNKFTYVLDPFGNIFYANLAKS